ncbi:hypothetical protein CONLIGDRAFT_573335 [Coniochaeta ligniaria NRRL 30616]|uniref:RNA-binding protein n=1 Tax=Coniochaeta ligniaria NRRL 30616 TaxID=1408157 RepID=A0A1J7JNC3_9PEZI|nr:hypothetical protein CONLIGDRAFT_573335 [Coniochaeta ligniaria NRRL 30616]
MASPDCSSLLANALLFSRKDSRSPHRNRYRDHDQPDTHYDPRTSQNVADSLDPGPSRLHYDDPLDGSPAEHDGRARSPRGLQRGQNPGRHSDYSDAAHDARPRSPRGSSGPSDDSGHRNASGRYGRDHHDHALGGRDHARSECLILGGLPDDVHEQDILTGLDFVSGDARLSTEQIKSVRIRTNRRGSRIAFVEFYRLSDATRFYDDFYPEISLPLQHSRGVDSEPVIATMDYSRPREDIDRPQGRMEDQGWDCTNCGGVNYPHRAVCYKCKTERPGYPGYATSYGGPILTGETDEDLRQNPSQFIVIRDLEPSVTEELLSKGVMKLFREEAPQPARDPSKPANKLKSTAPTNSSVGLGAAPGSLRRVFLIRDRRTNDSWKYGFAEFATIDDAKGAIAKFNASPRFTIASKPVIVAFIHTGVFVPVLEPVTEQTANFSFAPVYNPSLRVKYWDERAYPSSYAVSVGPELAPADGDTNAASSDNASSATQDAAAKRKKDRDALAAKIAAKKALVMAPQMQMWAKKAAEIHGAPAAKDADEDTAQSASADKPAAGGVSTTATQKSTEPVAPSWRDQYVSYADWDSIECLLCGKFSNEEWLIYHETHTHNHYKDEETKSKAAALLGSRNKEPRTVVRRTPRRKCDDPQPYTSYADQDNLTCYICMRKLPNVKTLRRHEQESEMHKKNLSDVTKLLQAKAKLAELDLKPTRMLPLGYDGPIRQGPQYRDRARERRQVYNQPKKPAPPRADGNKRKPEEPAAAAESEPAAKKSKGAGLLAKMGWTAGEGLGASGDGRTEAVGAEVYVPGVGLGAEGGKLGDASEEAAKKMVPGDFVEKTRERARERFERLQ